MTLPALPEPNFIDRDPAAITAEMVVAWETVTGKTLQPAQIERLLINQASYRETLVRIGIQETGKQNLLYYARSPVLAYLAQPLGVEQLAATPAVTTLRLTFPTAQALDIAIPLGTRIVAEGFANGAVFATRAAATLIAGNTIIDVPAACETLGPVGNGWAIGATGTLLDDLGVAGITVANHALSAGGAEAETDDNFRERIAEAPEKFTTAGSVGAYRYWARSAHPSIVDVQPRKHYPYPGDVTLYVLTATGLPSQPILDAVVAVCSDETIRPMCDEVYAAAPEQVDYAIIVQLTLYTGSDAAMALAAWRSAVEAYRVARSQALGLDVVRQQIDSLIKVAGVYKVTVVSPATDLVVERWQWANCTSATVSLAGYARG